MINYLRKNKQGTVLRHYFFTYFTVLLIPMLICCIYYVRLLLIIGTDDVKARKEELEHASVLVDTMFNEFEYLGDTLATNLQVNSFKKESKVLEYPNTYKIYELRNSLPDLYLTNQSVFDYFIYFDKSETVINKKIAYTYDEFYRLYLHEEQYGNYEEWYEQIKENSTILGMIPMTTYQYKQNTTHNMLVYNRPLMKLDKQGSGMIQIYIKESVLETMMPAIADNSILFIKDASDKLIYVRSGDSFTSWTMEEISELSSVGGAEQGNSWQQEVYLKGERYLMLGKTSNQSDMTYYILLPRNIVDNRMMSSILMLSIFIFLGVIVGIFLSYHMSVKSATPINDILNQVSQTTEQFGGHQSVFSTLKTTFNHLIATNSKLADAIENQKPYIRNAFMNRLVFGDFVKEEDAENIANQIGIPYQDRVFGVIIFRFHLFSEMISDGCQALMNSCVYSLLEVISKEIPDSLYTNLDNEQVLLLLSVSKEEQECFREKAECLIHTIRKAMPPNIAEKLFVYGGNEVIKLEQISESFHNAAYMFQNESGQIENEVIWYLESDTNIPAYPSQDLSVKLTHYVTAGDEKGLHDLLETVMRTYILENNLPVYLQHLLLNELQGILFRILGRVAIAEDEYRKYYILLEENHNAPMITQITTTLNLYKSVCKYVCEQKQLQDSDMVSTAIVSYIDVNYGNSALSLTSVADQFGISDPYLSSIFKQTQGINFSTYVEVVRIDKAKDFLKTTELTIGEIAELVGYGSSNSFCRAFKRVTGLNASEYRNKKIKLR